jgi:hypothetical protein
MDPSIITDTMTLGNGGKLHQEGSDRRWQVPAYKSVTVLWEEVLICFPPSNVPNKSEKKRAAIAAAINTIGFASLNNKQQKDREAIIIDWVRDNSDVTVKHSLVRRCFSKVRSEKARSKDVPK